MNTHRRSAVTLIELLVVMAIIAVLAGVLTPVVTAMQKQGRLAKETSAARQVMAAYLSAAGDENGALMAGYNAQVSARDDRGAPLKNPVNARYPWRLAPYLSYNLGVLYGNVGEGRLKRDRDREHEEWVYAVSVSPAFGINAVFVGGDYGSFNPENPRAVAAYGDFCVSHLGEALRPQKLVVFASACFADGNERIPGYFRVDAPFQTGRRWARQYKSNAGPTAYGYVDFRYNDRALVAMLDGHVELLDFEHLDDMRHWSNQAADLDNPDFDLRPQQ